MFGSTVENYTNFAKVYNTLPKKPRPNTFYAVLVKQGRQIDFYLTTSAGVPIPIINNELLLSLLESLINPVKSIDGYIVDVTNNTDKEVIEVGNLIQGYFSVNRYIIARVNALPHTDENNLSIFVDSQVI